MDYNSRMREIAEKVSRFLRLNFKQPEHMDNEAKVERIRQIAETINKRISAQSSPAGLADRVEATFQLVVETYRGKEWPSVAAFTDAAKETAPRREVTQHEPGEWVFDSVEVNCRRILGGEVVGDEWVYGRLAVDAIKAGKITEDDLKPYRSGLFFTMRDVVGSDAARSKETEFQEKHDAARQGAGLPHFFAIGNERATA